MCMRSVGAANTISSTSNVAGPYAHAPCPGGLRAGARRGWDGAGAGAEKGHGQAPPTSAVGNMLAPRSGQRSPVRRGWDGMVRVL
eukprot:364255-Chlamydomonas_euryale.AAC.9